MMKKTMNSIHDDEVFFKASTSWFRNWVRRFNCNSHNCQRHMEKEKKYELKMEGV